MGVDLWGGKRGAVVSCVWTRSFYMTRAISYGSGRGVGVGGESRRNCLDRDHRNGRWGSYLLPVA